MRYTAVDLLAGIGGMSKAFIEEGYQVDWAIDRDKDACKIFKHNYPEINIVQEDITNIQILEIPDSDILISGLPVTSFDTQELDYFLLTKVLAAKQPKAILFETVPNLETYNNGKTFKMIIDVLENQGFHIVYKTMNAKDYANLPCNKNRLYIVGFKDEISFNNFTFPEVISNDKSLLDIIDISEKKDDRYYYNKDSNFYHLLNEFNNETFWIYRRIGTNKLKAYKNICPLLLSPYTNYLIHDNYGIRNLTIQEYLEISGFNNFSVPVNIPLSRIFHLISNSSIVPLIRKIANQIRIALDRSIKANIQSEITFSLHHKYLDMSQSKILEGNEKIINNFPSLETLVINVENATNNHEKGKSLELLIKKFFEQVDGFTVNTNVNTKTEEIDITIINESKGEFWRKCTIYFIGECKNWNKKVGKNEFVIFKEKIENRQGEVGMGFFISWNGFANTFINESLRNSKKDFVIIPIDGNQIKEAIKSGNIEESIKQWHLNAVMS